MTTVRRKTTHITAAARLLAIRRAAPAACLIRIHPDAHAAYRWRLHR